MTYISVNPDIMGGKPCLKGHRISVAQLIEELIEDDSVFDGIVQEFELDKKDLVKMFKEVAASFNEDSKETKIRIIKELSDVPSNCGEQFINVSIHVGRQSGEIRFGWNWKSQMGECSFSTFDECIDILKKLRKDYSFNTVSD